MTIKTKIGLPKSFLWYKYHTLWGTFFEELGCEVVSSPDTNKRIVEEGVRKSVDELCIPVKVFYGHCLEIADKCDYIFVPRYWRLDKENITCPKIITIADTANQILKDKFSHKILETTVNVKVKPVSVSFFMVGLKLKKSPIRIVRAYRKAVCAQQAHENQLESQFGEKLAKPGLKLAVIGHDYNIYDKYINQELLSEIEKQDISVITSDLVPGSLRDKSLKGKPRIYWSYEKEIIGAAYWALYSEQISGIILISSFNCGPDSLLYEQVMLEDIDKPIIALLVDEYTSKETIKTRIDAFVELLNRKTREKNYERNCQLT